MARKNSRYIKNRNIRNKKIKNKKNKVPILLIIIVLIIVFINLQKNTKKISYENTQILINNENITMTLQDSIIVQNQKVYMSFQDIQTFLDETIYKEEETNLIITTGSKKLSTFKKNEENITINGVNQEKKDVLIEQEGKQYIAISELENVYDYDFEYIEETNIATIDYLNKECIKAYGAKNIKVKEQNKIFSSTIDKVDKGEWVFYIKEENGMAKIRTQNGVIGYVKQKLLNNFVTERDNFEEQQNTFSEQESLKYDISNNDITTFEKRQNLINQILQEAIKNDKMYIQILYNGTKDLKYERFKIEIEPVLKECGITVHI